MTREEEIREGNIPFYTDAEYNAFEQGAKWADEHPKSPWISVKDKLPEKGKEVIVYNGGIPTVFSATVRINPDRIGKYWILTNGQSKLIQDYEFWMSIPELPKKGGKQ